MPSIKTGASCTVRRLREASMTVKGLMLFNLLPRHIRDMEGCKTETFKKALDIWLSFIPDEPLVRGYTAMRRRESNSIRHMWTCVTTNDKCTISH